MVLYPGNSLKKPIGGLLRIHRQATITSPSVLNSTGTSSLAELPSVVGCKNSHGQDLQDFQQHKDNLNLNVLLRPD